MRQFTVAAPPLHTEDEDLRGTWLRLAGLEASGRISNLDSEIVTQVKDLMGGSNARGWSLSLMGPPSVVWAG